MTTAPAPRPAPLRASRARAAALLGACSEPPRFVSTDLSTVDWGKDFALTDHTGKPRRLADFRGKAVVLFFGYTQCPDVCPTTLSSMREAMTQGNRPEAIIDTMAGSSFGVYW